MLRVRRKSLRPSYLKNRLFSLTVSTLWRWDYNWGWFSILISPTQLGELLYLLYLFMNTPWSPQALSPQDENPRSGRSNTAVISHFVILLWLVGQLHGAALLAFVMKCANLNSFRPWIIWNNCNRISKYSYQQRVSSWFSLKCSVKRSVFISLKLTNWNQRFITAQAFTVIRFVFECMFSFDEALSAPSPFHSSNFPPQSETGYKFSANDAKWSKYRGRSYCSLKPLTHRWLARNSQTYFYLCCCYYISIATSSGMETPQHCQS